MSHSKLKCCIPVNESYLEDGASARDALAAVKKRLLTRFSRILFKYQNEKPCTCKLS